MFIPVAEPDLGAAEEEVLLDAIRSGWVSSSGRYITEFERSFAIFCNASHAACVSNGTVAIHLLLTAAGIGPGSEVIVPSFTFVATAAAVVHAGAVPVFVDCDPYTGTMDPRAVTLAVTERTKAIIAVHLYGHPAEMTPLRAIADANKLLLFEDAAEAHGALYRNRVVGSLSDAATFSFYGNKVITTGEGGMITTSDKLLDTRIRFLRDHAMDPSRRYWHPEIGYNYRMTNLQAALGTAQLKRFEEITKKRRTVLDRYRSANLERFGVRLNAKAEWAVPIPWLVCAIFDVERGNDVDRVVAALRNDGIDSRPFFIPLHEMPPYANYPRFAADGSPNLNETISLSSRGINLPSSGNLSDQCIERIISTLTSVLK